MALNRAWTYAELRSSSVPGNCLTPDISSSSNNPFYTQIMCLLLSSPSPPLVLSIILSYYWCSSPLRIKKTLHSCILVPKIHHYKHVWLLFCFIYVFESHLAGQCSEPLCSELTTGWLRTTWYVRD